MKLTDFDKKEHASRALSENYKLSFDVRKMSIVETKTMLKKVRGLALEAKQSRDFYEQQTSPTYMKLVFMEQALVSHHNDLASRPQPQIVVENEEVEKSQVVLAAQDMVDSVQKMIEQVSDIKELPALTDSVQSEIGVNESDQFNSQVAEALTSLMAALTQSKTTLQGALNTITGQGVDPAVEFGGAEEGGAGADMAAAGADMAAAGDEEGFGDDAGMTPTDEPEPQPVGGVGRAKR